MAKSVLYFTEVCMMGGNEFFNHVFHLDDLFVFRHFRDEKGTGAKMSRNCFWDRYWGRAGQLLVNVYSLFP